MQIEITPNDIEKMVKEAILKSSIGTAVQKAVSSVVNSSSYNNPIDDEIRKVVTEIAKELIKENYGPEIRTLVAEAMEKRVTKETLVKITESAMKLIEEAASNY